MRPLENNCNVPFEKLGIIPSRRGKEFFKLPFRLFRKESGGFFQNCGFYVEQEKTES